MRSTSSMTALLLTFSACTSPVAPPVAPVLQPAAVPQAVSAQEADPPPVDPSTTVQKTCSNQPSPALAANRRSEATCCYVPAGTWRTLFRPMVEAFAECPHGSGRVVVKVTIEEDGSIVEACVEHPASWTEPARSCLLSAVLNHRFPPEDYDFCPVRSIIYPLTFE